MNGRENDTGKDHRIIGLLCVDYGTKKCICPTLVLKQLKMKSRCAPISSGNKKANRYDGRFTIGCKRNSSSPRPSGTSPSGIRRGEHRSLRLPEKADEELHVASFRSIATESPFEALSTHNTVNRSVALR
jgi:hypothetical protein